MAARCADSEIEHSAHDNVMITPVVQGEEVALDPRHGIGQNRRPGATGTPFDALHMSWSPFVANLRQRDSWSLLSTLTTKLAPVCKATKRADSRAGRNATNGGSSDTEVNDPTTIPTGSPLLLIAVTRATPVGKWPSTSR